MKKSELKQIIREEVQNTLNEGSTKQTAVEWLMKKYERTGSLIETDFIEAKTMEKEKIKDAFNSGMNNSEDWFTDGTTEEAEQYYKETYGS